MKLITFIDHIGRTIVAEEQALTSEVLSVKNPVILHVQPNQQGQLSIQTIPLYFKEFLGAKSKENGTVWNFPVGAIVIGQNIDNEEKLVDAYKNMWAPTPPPTAPKVVKLFDSVE